MALNTLIITEELFDNESVYIEDNLIDIGYRKGDAIGNYLSEHGFIMSEPYTSGNYRVTRYTNSDIDSELESIDINVYQGSLTATVRTITYLSSLKINGKISSTSVNIPIIIEYSYNIIVLRKSFSSIPSQVMARCSNQATGELANTYLGYTAASGLLNSISMRSIGINRRGNIDEVIVCDHYMSSDTNLMLENAIISNNLDLVEYDEYIFNGVRYRKIGYGEYPVYYLLD